MMNIQSKINKYNEDNKDKSSDWNFVCLISEVDYSDFSEVGGKNASLGELKRVLEPKGGKVPEGLVVKASAFREFLRDNSLQAKISTAIEYYRQEQVSLQETGDRVRDLILSSKFPDPIAQEIMEGYQRLSNLCNNKDLDVAVRSSATAEDLPEASFAGQLDSFLNIRRPESLLKACRKCYASMFTDRAISYREKKGFDHLHTALCISIQEMIKASEGCSGVLFSIHKESGFKDIIVFSAAFGFGENIVEGMDNPDIYLIYKPFLGKEHCQPIIEKMLGYKHRKYVQSETEENLELVKLSAWERNSFVLEDKDILQLSYWARMIEDHFKMAMDIEWAKDGNTGELYCLQARPITDSPESEKKQLKVFKLKESARPILIGTSIGDGIVPGRVCLVEGGQDVHSLRGCQIIASEMANTLWLPIMQESRTQGLITDFGGPNSHAATISRELGILSVVGTQKATQVLKSGQDITIVCRKGDFGLVYDGLKGYETLHINPEEIPETNMKVRINLFSGQEAFQWWRLPSDGVGQVELNYILSQYIKVHPMALTNFDDLPESVIKSQIEKLSRPYQKRTDYFVQQICSQLAKMAAIQYPKSVIVKLNDLSGREYSELKGGQHFESDIGYNEVLGFKDIRSRITSDLELQAIKYLREKMFFDNIHLMIPACDSVEQAKEMLYNLAEKGLPADKEGFKVYLYCQCSQNISQAEDLADLFHGLSIDIEHVLPIAQDLGFIGLKGERGLTKAVEEILGRLINAGRDKKAEITLHGCILEEYRDLIPYLVDSGLDCLSVSPESLPVIKQWLFEQELKRHDG